MKSPFLDDYDYPSIGTASSVLFNVTSGATKSPRSCVDVMSYQSTDLHHGTPSNHHNPWNVSSSSHLNITHSSAAGIRSSRISRKLNKAAIMLFVLLLIYCNGLSVTADTAAIRENGDDDDSMVDCFKAIGDADYSKLITPRQPAEGRNNLADGERLTHSSPDDSNGKIGLARDKVHTTKEPEEGSSKSSTTTAVMDYANEYDSANYEGTNGTGANPSYEVHGIKNHSRPVTQESDSVAEHFMDDPAEFVGNYITIYPAESNGERTTIKKSRGTSKSRHRRTNYHLEIGEKAQTEQSLTASSSPEFQDDVGTGLKEEVIVAQNSPLRYLGSDKLNSESSSAGPNQQAAKKMFKSRSGRNYGKGRKHHPHYHGAAGFSKVLNEELEKRHRKFAKEKYQRKLDRASKMQLQRDLKLKQQQLQTAAFERQQQARQKVYFGNFADENQQFESVDDIDQHIDGRNKERYPNLARLQSQLKEDRDKDLPPYIRKFNRRNKQLFDIIEGTNSPGSVGKHHHHHHHHRHRQEPNNAATPAQHGHPGRGHLSRKAKIERWIEENLFEEQRRNPNQIMRSVAEDAEQLKLNQINTLPGESDRPTEGDVEDATNPRPSVNVITNRLSQTRAGNFVYHRIAQSQPSNAIGQAYGVIIRKPGLPFVAITDRRQEHGKPKRV